MRKRKNDTYDATGRTGKESAVIRSFWCEYTMEQVQQMSQEELDKSISDSLDRYAAERMKMDKRWDWPIPQGWSLIKRNKNSLDKKDKNII
jgi:hypothetical protein